MGTDDAEVSTTLPQATAPIESNSRRRALSLSLFILSVTLLVFGPVLWHEFLRWDDNQALWGNPDMVSPQPQLLGRLWLHPSHGYNGFYVPVTYTIWWVVACFAHRPGQVALDPTAFHALNLLFHCGSAVMVFLILRRLVKADLAALAGALFFAIHPLQTEPVSWASTMYTPLSGFFALAALWLYLIFSDARNDATGRRPAAAWVLFAAATLSFTLGLLTKPTIVVLPIIAFVIEVLPRRKSWKQCAPLLLWLLLGAVDGLITRQNHDGEFALHSALWVRPIIAADALAFYVWKVLAPFNLICDYGRSPRWLLAHPAIWLTGLVPAALGLLAWTLRRRRPGMAAGILVFLIAPAATLGLLPFNYQVFSTVADRYAYLAIFGAAMLVAFFMKWASERQWRMAFPAAAALLVGLGIMARSQLAYWNDTPTLMAHALDHNPTSLAAKGVLGDLLCIVNTPEAHREGLKFYREAVQEHPDDPIVRIWLGRQLFIDHNYREALEVYSQAAPLAPRSANPPYWVGRCLTMLHDRDGAIAAFSRTLQIEPDYGDTMLRLGDLLAEAGRTQEAAAYYHTILQRHPEATFVEDHLRKLTAQAGVDVR